MKIQFRQRVQKQAEMSTFRLTQLMAFRRPSTNPGADRSYFSVPAHCQSGAHRRLYRELVIVLTNGKYLFNVYCVRLVIYDQDLCLLLKYLGEDH